MEIRHRYECKKHDRLRFNSKPFHCTGCGGWVWSPKCPNDHGTMSTKFIPAFSGMPGTEFVGHECPVCRWRVTHNQEHTGVSCNVPGCIRFMEDQARFVAPTLDKKDMDALASCIKMVYWSSGSKADIASVVGSVLGAQRVWVFDRDDTSMIKPHQVAVVIEGQPAAPAVAEAMRSCVPAGLEMCGNQNLGHVRWYDINGLRGALALWARWSSYRDTEANIITQAVFGKSWASFVAEVKATGPLIIADDYTGNKPQPDKERALGWYRTTTGWGTISCPPRHAKTNALREWMDVEAAESSLRLNCGQEAVDEAKKMAMSSGLTYQQAIAHMLVRYTTQTSGMGQGKEPNHDDSVDALYHAYLAHQQQTSADTRVKQEHKVAEQMYGYSVEFKVDQKQLEEISRQIREEVGKASVEARIRQLEKQLLEQKELEGQAKKIRSMSHPGPTKLSQEGEETKRRLFEQYSGRTLQVKSFTITDAVGAVTKITSGHGVVTIHALDMEYDGQKLSHLLMMDNNANQDDLPAMKARKLWTPAQREAVAAWRSSQLKRRVDKSEAERQAQATSVVVGDDDLLLSNCRDVE